MAKQKGWLKGGRGSTSSRFTRRVAVIDERPRILIVCEGLKTEPNYFKGFKLTNVRLEIVPAGAVHVSVVEHAKSILEDDGDYEEMWCVFDRDKHVDNPKDLEVFNRALQEAQTNGINVAYSIDAFELWYLLHFNYYDTAISRADYITKLNDLIDGGYQKNDKKMFSKLESRLPDAMRNAKKLYEASNKKDPASSDPSTTVFMLVERLIDLG